MCLLRASNLLLAASLLAKRTLVRHEDPSIPPSRAVQKSTPQRVPFSEKVPHVLVCPSAGLSGSAGLTSWASSIYLRRP